MLCRVETVGRVEGLAARLAKVGKKERGGKREDGSQEEGTYRGEGEKKAMSFLHKSISTYIPYPEDSPAH